MYLKSSVVQVLFRVLILKRAFSGISYRYASSVVVTGDFRVVMRKQFLRTALCMWMNYREWGKYSVDQQQAIVQLINYVVQKWKLPIRLAQRWLLGLVANSETSVYGLITCEELSWFASKITGWALLMKSMIRFVRAGLNFFSGLLSLHCYYALY